MGVVVVMGVSGLWGEGGIERREGDVEMKEVLKEGRERRELQGVTNLRESDTLCMCRGKGIQY